MGETVGRKCWGGGGAARSLIERAWAGKAPGKEDI